MAAHKKCCVPLCDNTRDNNILHRFPNPQKECERFRNWVFAIGGYILALDDTYVYKSRRICHLHFEQRYWTRSKMLSKNAVPTLYLKGEVPLVDKTNINVTENNQEIATSSECDITTDMKIDNAVKTYSARKVNILQKKLEKLTGQNEKYAMKIKKAIKLAENRKFQSTLKKFTSRAAIFTDLQFREIKKGKIGRKFSEQERIMALSIYKAWSTMLQNFEKSICVSSTNS